MLLPSKELHETFFRETKKEKRKIDEESKNSTTVQVQLNAPDIQHDASMTLGLGAMHISDAWSAHTMQRESVLTSEILIRGRTNPYMIPARWKNFYVAVAHYPPINI